MPRIELVTIIDAPIARAFDLARSVDIHLHSTAHTNEKAISGKTSGLLEMLDTVTWRAKHLGFYQNLSVKIKIFGRPHIFQDVMTKGIFQKMEHTHQFIDQGSETKMIDIFIYQPPLGIIGRLVNYLFLEQYMTDFLLRKNKILKRVAEDEIS